MDIGCNFAHVWCHAATEYHEIDLGFPPADITNVDLANGRQFKLKWRTPQAGPPGILANRCLAEISPGRGPKLPRMV